MPVPHDRIDLVSKSLNLMKMRDTATPYMDNPFLFKSSVELLPIGTIHILDYRYGVPINLAEVWEFPSSVVDKRKP